jgi:hypothetical protein
MFKQGGPRSKLRNRRTSGLPAYTFIQLKGFFTQFLGSCNLLREPDNMNCNTHFLLSPFEHKHHHHYESHVHLSENNHYYERQRDVSTLWPVFILTLIRPTKKYSLIFLFLKLLLHWSRLLIITIRKEGITAPKI